jgi:predicted metalloprotease
MAVGGGGILVVIIVLALQFFNAPPAVQQIGGQIAQQIQQGAAAAPTAGDGIDDEVREFISVVLRDTEQVWAKLFEEQVQGASYTPPKLVIYSGTDRSGCGPARSEMGPFYCPADRTVYIDPQFFNELAQRYDAPGDFAAAYVIAHEVAHHVQNLIGFSDLVDRARRTGDERQANRMSVRLELQADFLAGVWANHADRQYDILEAGDIEEAIAAAFQIGDDTLQKNATGQIRPEHFTHGTSKQRTAWFRKGAASGNLQACEQLFQLDYNEL